VQYKSTAIANHGGQGITHPGGSPHGVGHGLSTFQRLQQQWHRSRSSISNWLAASVPPLPCPAPPWSAATCSHLYSQ